MKNFLVRVQCMTYNQHAYISDAMNGFTMQQTNFPYVCTIVDDASTDGEQEMIRNYVNDNFDLSASSIAYEKDTDYGHVTFAQHKINKNCYFAVIYLNENHYSQRKPKTPYFKEWDDQVKYIALCEGDDYWTHPQKLQKQVVFLEEHDGYVLSAHNAIMKYENSGEMSCFNKWYDNTVFGYEDIILKDWFLPSQSLLYRKDVSLKNQLERSFYNGDYCLQLLLTKDGGLVHYLNECLSVYRVGVGISSKVSEYDNNTRLIELLEYMKDLSDVKYWPLFEKHVVRLQNKNKKILELKKNKNGMKLWYRIRFKLLSVFVKLLRFNNPKVVFYRLLE